ncbi:TPA: metallophosphoesterase [Candidatus Gastranaerophilales bacterium HUM_20]|nr:ser/Thr protein phosphatase family protein [Clostridium sp. CAG:729]DAB24305.1 MAG TPA: metallophosphoesterase [Candidatus Gastranaerophilales bacterium HUM_20]
MTGDGKTIKILFLGDLVGRPGRFVVRDFLKKQRENYDFIIANVENASHGFGLTEKNYNEISEYGIDCMTSGNHIWDKREILNYIDKADRLVRPFNYPNGTPGRGSKVFELDNGVKVAVINALGRVFMAPVDSQWETVADEIKRLKEITQIIIVDFHAEATAEKICFGRFCADLGASAFFGTHTHVQTADEQIVNNMGYITDAGFCGTSDGVIGMEYNTSLNRFTTCIPERYEVADGNVVQINAVEVEIDSTSGHAAAIKRIFCYVDENEKEEDNEK